MSVTEEVFYNPNRLLDILLAARNLKNDAALARVLEVAPPVLSKLRHHRLPLGPAMTIRIMEKFDMALTELRAHLQTGPA